MRKSILCAAAFALTPLAAQAGESVRYSVGDAEFKGYFAEAEGDSKGLVLVIHDWDGMTPYEETRADMLAGLGYDAFAVDLYGADVVADTVDHRRALTGALYSDRQTMRDRLEAGLAKARELAGDGGVTVAMGYCFGGAATLEMARANVEGVDGYASFHGGLQTPEGQSYEGTSSPIMIYHGGADTAIPMSQVAALSEELEASGTPYEMQVYSGAPHAFTVFGSNRYQEQADQQSWRSFTDFLSSLSEG